MRNHNSIQELCSGPGSEPEFALGALHGLRTWTLARTGSLKGHKGFFWNAGEVHVARCYAGASLIDDVAVFLADNTAREIREYLELMFRQLYASLPPHADRSRVHATVSFRDVLGSPRLTVLPEAEIPLPPSLFRGPGDTLGDTHAIKATLVYYADENHRPATPDCTCGFYAYTSENARLANLPTTWRRPAPAEYTGITGVIKGYGYVTEGTMGFRCEKAEIVALTRPDKPEIERAWIKAGVTVFPDVPSLLAVARREYGIR